MARKPLDGDALARKMYEIINNTPSWSAPKMDRAIIKATALYLKHRPESTAPTEDHA